MKKINLGDTEGHEHKLQTVLIIKKKSHQENAQIIVPSILGEAFL